MGLAPVIAIDFLLAVFLCLLAGGWQYITFRNWHYRLSRTPYLERPRFYPAHRTGVWISVALQLPMLYYFGVLAHTFYIYQATHLTLSEPMSYYGITLPAGSEVVTQQPFDYSQLKSARASTPFLVNGIAVTRIQFGPLHHELTLVQPTPIDDWLCDSRSAVLLGWSHRLNANEAGEAGMDIDEQVSQFNRRTPAQWFLQQCTLVANQSHFGLVWPTGSTVKREWTTISLRNQADFRPDTRPVPYQNGELSEIVLLLNPKRQVQYCRFSVSQPITIKGQRFLPDKIYSSEPDQPCPLPLPPEETKASH